MQIGSFQSSPPSLLTRAPAGEAAERGADHDNDGDEGAQSLSTAASAARLAQSLNSSGRGQRVNMLA